MTGKALSERENEILETGELSKSGDGGGLMSGRSDCKKKLMNECKLQ